MLRNFNVHVGLVCTVIHLFPMYSTATQLQTFANEKHTLRKADAKQLVL